MVYFEIVGMSIFVLFFGYLIIRLLSKAIFRSWKEVFHIRKEEK